MNPESYLNNVFGLSGRVAVVIGGTGELCDVIVLILDPACDAGFCGAGCAAPEGRFVMRREPPSLGHPARAQRGSRARDIDRGLGAL